MYVEVTVGKSRKLSYIYKENCTCGGIGCCGARWLQQLGRLKPDAAGSSHMGHPGLHFSSFPALLKDKTPFLGSLTLTTPVTR